MLFVSENGGERIRVKAVFIKGKRTADYMIKPRLTELNRDEILHYLGYRGQEITLQVERQIEECIRQTRVYARPRLVYRRLPVRKGEIVGLPLNGRDILRVLRPCREAVLLAVTLGPEIERHMMRSEVVNMSEAVIMDACASAAAENVCDRFEEDLREELRREEGFFLTGRYSPGYGDFPIAFQEKLCEVLDTARRIGLTVTDRHIMVPRKSVTAVMGIAEEPQELQTRGCEACSMFQNCLYRKNKTDCGQRILEGTGASL